MHELAAIKGIIAKAGVLWRTGMKARLGKRFKRALGLRFDDTCSSVD